MQLIACDSEVYIIHGWEFLKFSTGPGGFRMTLVVILATALGLSFTNISQAGDTPSTPDGEKAMSTSEAPSGTVNPGGPDGLSPREVSRETSVLIDVFLQMRLASELMRQDDWQKSAAVQAQVIARLDELLKRPPSQAPPSSGRAPQPMADVKPVTPEPQPTAQPQQAKTAPTGQVGSDPTASGQNQLEELRSILRGLWGELPERVRAQVSETLAEEFLPRYAPLIREYYRRLAELSSPPRGNAPSAPRSP